jgi:hypothetical protein
MTISTLRDFLCCFIIFLLPFSLMASEPGAIVYVSGSTSVNGALVPRSSPVLPGDIVRTMGSSQANLSAAGISVTIFENSVVKFETNGISIEDGSASIRATAGTGSRAGIVNVTSASGGWTQFEMTRRNGAVLIVAREGDVNVTAGTDTITLRQGQFETRDDTAASAGSGKQNKKKKSQEGPTPTVSTRTVDSPILIGVGAAAVGAGLVYVLTRDSSPVSPVVP